MLRVKTLEQLIINGVTYPVDSIIVMVDDDAYTLMEENKVTDILGVQVITGGTETAVLNGLNMKINSFKLPLLDGTQFSYIGENKQLFDNTTQYIGISLFENKAHIFPRMIDTNMIWIAKITTSNGVVTEKINISPVIPKTTLFSWKQNKSNTNKTIKIGLMGDSLTEGAGGTPRWASLLFDVAQVAQGYNISGIAHTTTDNYGIGGATSWLGLLQTGEQVSGDYSNGEYPDANVNYFKKSAMKYRTDVIIKPSKLLSEYDAIIVGYGANGGTYNNENMENIVRNIRENNIPVIIQTENTNSTTLDYLQSTTNFYGKLAEHYGCELSDTWSYVWEARMNGETCHADTIHMNANGHTKWANAIRNTLNDIFQDKKDVVFPQKRIGNPDVQYLANQFPKKTYIVSNPKTAAGIYIASGQDDSFKNPLQAFGIKANTANVLSLQPTQSASFAGENASIFCLVYDAKVDSVIELRNANNGTLLDTITVTGLGYTRLMTKNLVTPLATIDDKFSKNIGVRAICIGGEARIYCGFWYTHKVEELEFEKIGTYTGTWGQAGHTLGGNTIPFVKYTDTTNDIAIIPFTGSGIHVTLGKSTSGGQVEFTLDGTVHSTGELYVGGGNYAQTFQIYPTNLSNYGEHVLKIKLTGANGSAVATTTNARRLPIINCYAIDRR